jgi:hypothetical protein
MVTWEEPPEPRGRPSLVDYEAIVKELESQPGTWAKIIVAPTRGTASTIATGLRRNGCETTIRSGDDGFTVYARHEPF